MTTNTDTTVGLGPGDPQAILGITPIFGTVEP